VAVDAPQAAVRHLARPQGFFVQSCNLAVLPSEGHEIQERKTARLHQKRLRSSTNRLFCFSFVEVGTMREIDPLKNLARETEMLRRAYVEFEGPFKRSTRGNLWRHYDGRILTVFSRGERYCWSIKNGDETSYSPESYETEEDAMSALAHVMEVDMIDGIEGASQ
jgi:hypothetical protein